MCTTTDISQIIGNKEVSVVAGPTFLERPVRQGLSGTKSPAGNPAESGPVGKLIKSFGLPASDPFLAHKRVQSSERVSFKRAKTLGSVEISTFLIETIESIVSRRHRGTRSKRIRFISRPLSRFR